MTQAAALPARRWLRAATATVVAAAAPLSLLFALRLAAGLEAFAIVPALLGLALGVVAADAFSGLVHWACDTWGSERTPWLGPTLIHSFREHHVDPRAMLGHDWVEVNREPAAAATLALCVLLSEPVATWLGARPLAHGFLCSFVAASAIANQLHFWAHARRPPRWVRWLQRRRLVLSPRAHAQHHRAPNTRAYCISSGWLNTPLDAIGFWRGLERLVQRTTGFAPRAAGQPDRDGRARASRHG